MQKIQSGKIFKSIVLVFILALCLGAIVTTAAIKVDSNSALAATDVAKVGSTNYTTFESAYTAVPNNGTIELLEDVSLSSSQSWTKSFTLKSASGTKTVKPQTKTEESVFIYIRGGAELTIEDIIIDGLRDADTVKPNACAFFVEDGSTLNIKNGATIQNFHISTTGAAVYLKEGTLNMSGGEIKNNYVTNASGIVYGGSYASLSVTVNITGGVIKDNGFFNNANTGAVHLINNAVLTIGGDAQVYDNFYGTEAKDIYLPTGKQINLNSDFTGNALVYAVDDIATTVGKNNGFSGADNLINAKADNVVGYAKPNGDIVWQLAIFYNLNGGTVATGNLATYIATDSVVIANNPSKENYNFVGWYEDSSFDVPFVSGVQNNPKSLTLYAKYTAVDYNINYLLDGGTDSGTNPSKYTVEDEDIVLTSPTKMGYIFNGWYTGVGLDTKVEIIVQGSAGDITLTAIWTPKQTTITFNSNGGSVVSAVTQDYNSDITAPTSPTKVGYSFDGWFSDAGLLEVFIFDKMPLENITLYASWVINQYTVTFDTKGGTIIAPKTQDYNTTFSLPTMPSKLGYKFNGWYNAKDNKIVATLSNALTQDTTFYVKWTEDLPYTVSGSTVYFGEWPQSAKTSSVTITQQRDSANNYFGSDGNRYKYYSGSYYKIERISWKIVGGTSTQPILMSNKILDSMRYAASSNVYANSELHKWLIGTFYNTAFNSLQQSLMQNHAGYKVVAPDKAELEDWGLNTNAKRQRSYTAYTLARGIYPNQNNGTTSYYLTRTPHSTGKVYRVQGGGVFAETVVYDSSAGVVPVIKINVSSTASEYVKNQSYIDLHTVYESYQRENYTQESWDMLLQERDNALSAVSGLSTTASINTAKDNGLAQMSAIPTIEQQPLYDAKQDAKQAIIDAYNGYIEADYSIDNWLELTQIRDSAINAIDAVDDLVDFLPAITQAKEQGIIGMDNVITIEEDLDAAKQQAKDIIDNYIHYQEAITTEVQHIIDTAKNDIAQAETIEDIAIILEQARQDLDAEVLAEIKEFAILDLKEYTDYENADQTIKDIVDGAIIAIEDLGVISIEEVTSIFAQTKTDIDLQIAKQEAVAIIEQAYQSYNQADYSTNGNGQLLDVSGTAIINITSAENIAMLNNIKEQTLQSLANVPTLLEEIEDAKANAIFEMQVYYQDNYGAKYGEQLPITIENFIAEHANQIDENNYDNQMEIDSIVASGKSQIDNYYIVVGSVRNDLEQHYQDQYSLDFGAELPDEIDKIIIWQEGKVNEQNYIIVEEIGALVQDGIQLMDSYILAIEHVLDTLETYYDDLSQVYGKATNEGGDIDYVEIIIEDYLKNVTAENFLDAEAITEIIIDGKEVIYGYYLNQSEQVKISILEDYIYSGLAQEDYSEENWMAIEQILEDAINDLSQIDIIEDVDSYNLQPYMDSIDGVETIAQTVTREIIEAKNDLFDALTAYIEKSTAPQLQDMIDGFVDGVDSDNYTDLATLINDAKSALLIEEQNYIKAQIDNNKPQVEHAMHDYVDGSFEDLLDCFSEYYKDLIDSDLSIDAVADTLSAYTNTLDGLQEIVALG